MYSFGETEKEVKASKYLKKYLKIKEYSEKDKRIASEMLLEFLGDVTLPPGIIEQFIDYYKCTGGRYNVRHEKESSLELYKFYKKFPTITPDAFDDIAFLYIKDLYDKYDLIKYFEDMIAKYGETDEAFDHFIHYVKRSADLLQIQYDHDALKMNKYYKLYGEKEGYSFDGFISNLYCDIRRKHLPVDKVIEMLKEFNAF